MYTPSDRMLRIAQALKDEVDRHLASHHRLVDFAKRFRVGRSTLSAAFHKLTSRSLENYLEVARAEAAIAIMRRSPERTLRDIAKEVGYRKTRRLRYAFTITFGKTPKAVLNEIRRPV